MEVWPGESRPLGATWDGQGVNFALFSQDATKVELCLFDSADPCREVARLELQERDNHVWHAYLPGIRPGQLYGYRVHGAYSPDEGLRFNPAKLLIDPYVRALAGKVDWSAPVFGYTVGSEQEDLSRDEEDSGWGVPKGVVLDPSFDWGADRPPRTPWHRTVIYEAHVKGLTALHPEVEAGLRGSYTGLASPAVIEHLQKLGITAVELMPIHAFLDDKFLTEKGLRNYWGYSSIGYFAPEARYSSSGDQGGQVREFKEMVKTLHGAGIEVILDVVYNHTAEGNHLGPTLSFKGIDNRAYYRLKPDQPRNYEDYTAMGNTLNTRHPQTLKLVMDSLRYWVQEMHVDGFRFDLAPTLARGARYVDPVSPFFDLIHQDPVISTVKLVAEPWDIGEGGNQSGDFPVLWTEWNGSFRDEVRRFWRGDEGQVRDLAYRLTGSSDLYQDDGRSPHASINFVACHDGMTLHDIVSYSRKYNEANGEDNRDGTNDNFCWNCGAEGPSDDPGVLGLRDLQMRNMLATLMFSQGVPMICGGDEVGRSQRGNNNAYCQDNETSWTDWELTDRETGLLRFAQRLARIRNQNPVLRRWKYFEGSAPRKSGVKDIAWFCPDGSEMNDRSWGMQQLRSLGIWLSGEGLNESDAHGKPITGESLLLLLNAGAEVVAFTLPAMIPDSSWQTLIDTTQPAMESDGPERTGSRFKLPGRSLVLFKLVRAKPAE
jgi:isoamylase